MGDQVNGAVNIVVTKEIESKIYEDRDTLFESVRVCFGELSFQHYKESFRKDYDRKNKDFLVFLFDMAQMHDHTVSRYSKGLKEYHFSINDDFGDEVEPTLAYLAQCGAKIEGEFFGEIDQRWTYTSALNSGILVKDTIESVPAKELAVLKEKASAFDEVMSIWTSRDLSTEERATFTARKLINQLAEFVGQ